ncbi:pyridoxamine 5'-phosphate oxidase family protein [Stenotrophomonas sp. NPDC101269]|uniref:pyridoxamine 5'-phosphate oxidase family protein n=1 Tax=Stenotrophomonas TaxID=40323 RepID=UPI00129209F1|nr:pyridoxamine 5'-phosphate oxidase family protein [Stenotrophomonas nematodicola]
MPEHDRLQHIRQLAEMIRGIDIAMFTTVGVDGRLYSRPLGTQEVEFDGDLWFATAADSPKVAEIALNPRVNVAYASTSGNTYVSVAGTARVIDDRAKAEELWSPAMKLFFPGGPDDPNLRLIHVSAESAEYWDGPGGLLGSALSFVLSAMNDEPGALSDNGVVDLR